MALELLLATGNNHKVEEIQQILKGIAIRYRTTNEWPNFTEVTESGSTYEENAVEKARTWCSRTELWTLADDSGLEVDALGGRPGLRSARYAPTTALRIRKLLDEMADVPDGKRTARFVCSVALCGPGGRQEVRRGVLEGTIGREERGAGGFGYDPVFLPEGHGGAHLAELTSRTKNQISHRGRALAALRAVLTDLAGPA